MNKEICIFIIRAVIAIFVFAGLTVFAGYKINAYKCPIKWASYETKFDFWGGCQVKVNDKWVPSQALRVL